MHPIKWIRKNERKIMTVVVILIMIAFIGGSALQQFMSRINPDKKAVAFYGQKGKIAPRDLRAAQSELEVLKALGMPKLLVGMDDIGAELLGQVLFGSDSQVSVYVSDRMKQRIVQGQLVVGISDVDAFFMQVGGRSELNWLLLKAEARAAGCVIPLETAKRMLKLVVPQIMPGTDAGQLVDYLVKNHRITEEKIMGVVANLLEILSYAKIITGNEELTIAQIRSTMGRTAEKIDAEFIKIEAADFIGKIEMPDDAQLTKQFEQYKGVAAGLCAPDNPYGFGYKLPAMVTLEYILVKLEDIEALIEEPDQKDMEDFYRQNRDNQSYSNMFQFTMRMDPNDPASETTQIRTYSQAQALIKKHFKQQRTASRADMIFNRASELTEAGFAGEDIDQADAEKLKSLATDYAGSAEKLKAEFNLEVYTGKTGMLSIEDFSKTKYLSSMVAQGQSKIPTGLANLLFSIDEIGLTKLGRFDASGPKMWSNVGPVKDRFGSIMVMARIVEAQKAAVPESIDLSFGKKAIELDGADDELETYSVKGAVERDCRLVKAMSIAKARADELAGMVAESGWDKGVNKFNEKYFSKPSDESEKAAIEKMTSQSKVSLADIELTKILAKDFPDMADNMQERLNVGRLAGQFYSLLPAGETEGINLQTVIEFAPDLSYYLVKDVSRAEVNEQEYFGVKKVIAYQTESMRVSSLSLAHFMPENIRQRMEFRSAEPKEQAPQKDTSGVKRIKGMIKKPQKTSFCGQKPE